MHVNVSQFEALGYTVVDGLFSPAEIDELRRRVLAQASVGNYHSEGWSIVDFMRRPSFDFMHTLPQAPRIAAVLSHLLP